MKNAWWKEAVVYQIYPRSFQDSNHDGIGDLNGITEHLDYIKDLGADVIWLCPVYASPNADNGYDISDYCAIMKDFGTMEDFDYLLEEAHKRGIRIIMDLVVNHTSDEHKWFVESRKSKDNPYRDYYIWKEGKDGKEPNELESCFEGSAWKYDKETDMYYLHYYTEKQVDLNWENPNMRQDVYKFMHWWFKKGIDGFRMDVINQIAKDFDLLDQYKKGDHRDDFISNRPKVHEYLQEMNREVLSHYDIMTVGETGGVTIEDAKKYAGFDTNELSMIFQFEHMSLDKGDMNKLEVIRPELSKLRSVLSKWQTELYGIAWNSLYFENHDRPRTVSKYGDDSTPLYWEKSAKMLATLLLMMQGTPYIYQGQEIGMKNAYFQSMSQYRDVETINKYNQWKNRFDEETLIHYFGKRSRDNTRTPMQWTSEKYGGFSDVKPWIDLPQGHEEISVEKQLYDKNSILQYYKKLIRMRKEYKDVIVYGTYKLLLEEDRHLFCYERENHDQKLLIVCNYTKEEVKLPTELLENTEVLLLSNYNDQVSNETLLKSYESRIYLVK